MSFRNISEHYWEPEKPMATCLDCQKDPTKVCAAHVTDELWSLEEMRQGEVELLARQLHDILKDHPNESICGACRATFRQASERLKTLGVVAK